MKISIPSVLIAFALICFALVQNAQAVSPAPDGGYAGANTAEGNGALLHLTTGTNNTAVGSEALLNVNSASQNTAVGAQTLQEQRFPKYRLSVFRRLQEMALAVIRLPAGALCLGTRAALAMQPTGTVRSTATQSVRRTRRLATRRSTAMLPAVAMSLLGLKRTSAAVTTILRSVTLRSDRVYPAISKYSARFRCALPQLVGQLEYSYGGERARI